MSDSTHIDFCVKSRTLNVQHITQLLQVAPTSGFGPNERYIGKAKHGDAIVNVERIRPSFGVWHLSTEGEIGSNSVEDHARLLIDRLRPAKDGIENLLQDAAYEVILSLWCVGLRGFDVSSHTLSQLASISKYVSVRFFEAEEISTSAVNAS